MRSQPRTMPALVETPSRIGFCRHCGARVVCGPRLRTPHLTLAASHLRRMHPEVLGLALTPTSAVLVAQLRFLIAPVVLHPSPAVECRGDPVSRDAA